MPDDETDLTHTLLNTVAERVQTWNDSHNHGHPLFPPATEAEVHAAEERMGFSLPPFLRLLYTRVANGGVGIRQLRRNQTGYFAPESGLYGIAGGCPFGFELNQYRQLPKIISGNGQVTEERRTIEDGVSHSGWRLDTESWASFTYDLDSDDPDGWTWLYDTCCPSCGHYMLDLHTGHIWSTRPHFAKPGWPYFADHEFPSVEALFESWLR